MPVVKKVPSVIKFFVYKKSFFFFLTFCNIPITLFIRCISAKKKKIVQKGSKNFAYHNKEKKKKMFENKNMLFDGPKSLTIIVDVEKRF